MYIQYIKDLSEYESRLYEAMDRIGLETLKIITKYVTSGYVGWVENIVQL